MSPTKLLPDFRSDEQVVAVVRRHWFILFKKIAGVLIIYLIPFFFVPFLLAIMAQTATIPIPAGFGFLLAAAWTLIAWNLLFARWTDYYYDVWIITTHRIIDIDQRGFFHRDVATLFDLGHIQDVKTVLLGVFGNILNYGLVQVQTAASAREFVMDGIANPTRVEKIIRKTQHELYLRKSRERGAI